MNKRSTKFYRKNEAEVMERLGFKPTKNSGAGWVEKEDGQNDFAICQLKSTDKQSISIKQSDLHILEHNAAVSHKLPVFALQFLNTDEIWVMIKPTDLEAIQSLVRNRIVSNELLPTNNLFENAKEIIDNETNEVYNSSMDIANASESYKARQAYIKQREKERKEQQEEYKKRRKTNWRKNLTKKA